jgi:hypothetical protein
VENLHVSPGISSSVFFRGPRLMVVTGWLRAAWTWPVAATSQHRLYGGHDHAGGRLGAGRAEMRVARAHSPVSEPQRPCCRSGAIRQDVKDVRVPQVRAGPVRTEPPGDVGCPCRLAGPAGLEDEGWGGQQQHRLRQGQGDLTDLLVPRFEGGRACLRDDRVVGEARRQDQDVEGSRAPRPGLARRDPLQDRQEPARVGVVMGNREGSSQRRPAAVCQPGFVVAVVPELQGRDGGGDSFCRSPPWWMIWLPTE